MKQRSDAGRRAAARVVMALAVVAGLGACASTTDSQSSDVATVDAAKDSGAGSGPIGPAAESAVADGDATRSASPAITPVVAERAMVSTGHLRLVVDRVGRTSVRAERLAAARGGFVAGEDAGSSDAASDEVATLTIKVPAADFRPLLAELADLGKVDSRSVTVDDVTATAVDLDARILSAARSVDRVRAFLDEAKNVGELSGVEGELLRRETELEQLQAQRRTLGEQVALATIELTLSPTPAPVPKVAATDPWRSVPGFGSALSTGVHWLAVAGRLLAAALGFLAPVLVLVAVPLGVRRVWRRRRSPAPAA